MDSKIFSLEIFVDRIRLAAGEKCLFPSTILKLLSYEPAQISSIDKNIQENLREYIDPIESSDKNKIKQIDDLKDREGNFLIRKGKSILFEAQLVSLMAELNVLPLYIIVTDDYYDPNHLVGVVTVNLSSLLQGLSKKISHFSCTVSEDIAGGFPVVNLMGDGIGVITMRLRLIYIGNNIGRHVTQEQEIELRAKKDSTCGTASKSVGSGYVYNKNIVDNKPYESPQSVMVRNFSCQVDEKRSIRIQVQPTLPSDDINHDRTARIGLTIDPNDPLLEGPPPLIYNSHYEKEGVYYEEDEYSHCNSEKATNNDRKPLSKASLPKNLPLLNALFSELKAWKSEDFVEEKLEPLKPTTKKVVNRSKSVEPVPRAIEKIVTEKNGSEFLQRMSKPKIRPSSPTGIVPKNLGWIRTEPQFAGPKKSNLEYKLTKTQLKRMELRNTFKKSPVKTTDKIMEQKSFDGDNTATSYTERPPNVRHPLVPPLFNPGTSISVPSFTQTDSSSQPQRLPPKSPDRQRNNNNNSQTVFSYQTDDTVDEAEHILNLNPVQSNRSPQMTIRSQTAAVDYDEEDYDESQEDRRQHDNRLEEYSDDNNASFSSSNGPRSVSRRYSNASQISQTSEWRTEYSRASSLSQNYINKQESPPQSPEIGSYRSPPKSPVKSRKSLLASGVVPGGRFNEISSSRNMMSSDSFAASFNESAEQRTNYTTSASINSVTERNRENNMVRSFDLIDGNRSQLRPSSAGGDVTSFTKVTKYDRSLAPGRQSNMGTNHLTSTAASMQTDNSQVFTSDSFY